MSAVKVILRKGPQEYHSAPVGCVSYNAKRVVGDYESIRTCSRGSAVVKALEVGSRVDQVARGEDVDLLDGVPAVVIT